MNFDTLCNQLHINNQGFNESDLSILKSWFNKNMSTDNEFTGSLQEQWEQYKEIITFYFKVFLPMQKSQLNQEVVEKIIDLGLDVLLLKLPDHLVLLNRANQYGQTPLHIAAVRGFLNTAKILLDRGADVKALNRSKQTPLFSCLILPVMHEETTKQNKIAIFKLLLARSDDIIDQTDDIGNTILHQMVVHDFGDLIDEFLQKYSKLSCIMNNFIMYPIHLAISNNQMHNAYELLKIKNNAILADRNRQTALHYAALINDINLIKACHQQGCPIDILDNQNRTAAMLAAEKGLIDVVKVLIDLGSNVSLQDSYGFTILHYAVISKNKDLVKWLLENTSVSLEIKNEKNETALDLLMKQTEHDIELIQILTNHKTDLNNFNDH